MWKTTPTCRDWSKCSPCLATMSNRSDGDQSAQLVGLEVIGRHQVLLVAARCHEQRSRRVVATVGEELQREERVSRATLAEVELDRVGRPPSASVADDDEVDREAAQRALLREPVADGIGVPVIARGVLAARGEHAAEIALTAGATRAAGRGSRAAPRHRRAGPGAARSGCGSPPRRSAPRRCPLPRRTWPGRRRGASPGDSSSIARSRSVTAARSSADPGAGSPPSRTTALPAPETPSLSLTMALSIWVARRRIRRSASAISSRVRRFSTPSGWGTSISANSRRQPVLEPSGASRGSAPYIGISRLIAMSRSSSVVL